MIRPSFAQTTKRLDAKAAFSESNWRTKILKTPLALEPVQNVQGFREFLRRGGHGVLGLAYDVVFLLAYSVVSLLAYPVERRFTFALTGNCSCFRRAIKMTNPPDGLDANAAFSESNCR
jgi:hypothetical protein